MSYTKSHVSPAEYHIQHMIYNSNIVKVPKPYTYDKNTSQLTMQLIPNMSIADQYGEDFESVPSHIIEKIREIIRILYYHGLEYPDITGYNFIEWNDDVWIIDFEHATYKGNVSSFDPFILEFINGHEGWNPEFA